MNQLDITLTSPAENIALDEALLDAAEAGESGEVLRFWESPTHFVVVGYANKVATEVNIPACEAKGVPILRRCSGGGTVVQGPGCLNYAVILRITETGPTRSINSVNSFVMERTRDALQSAINNPQSAILIRGHTDLAMVTHHTARTTLKFSGNAQRRRKNFLLFHGSLLLRFDLPLISELLNMPSLQPEYREGRAHDQFVMNLGIEPAYVKNELRKIWGADAEQVMVPQQRMDRLVSEKYLKSEWNLKM